MTGREDIDYATRYQTGVAGAFDVFRRGIDLFRYAEVVEIKAGGAPPRARCRYCGRWNYHLKSCARSVRVARARAARESFSDPELRELRWQYVIETLQKLELAQRELANNGAAMG